MVQSQTLRVMDYGERTTGLILLTKDRSYLQDYQNTWMESKEYESFKNRVISAELDILKRLGTHYSSFLKGCVDLQPLSYITRL